MLLVGIAILVSTVNPAKLGLNLDNALSRFISLGDIENTSKQRINIPRFYEVVSEKLDENPIGIGPGRTGAATSISTAFIEIDPLYGKNSSWAHDNLFISLFIDLGWGALFYISIILLFPMSLYYYAFTKYKQNELHSFRIIIISAISSSVFIFGNWGVIGLTYNPESMMYWFWIALGWREFYKDVSAHS